ncbi:MAG TPA: hypothetical protein VGT61_15505 [Thermomicrobiales bacterium]|jgi:hypothetical protein|nr:hypothetical protein [Thermomicrobiales bacterium]
MTRRDDTTEQDERFWARAGGNVSSDDAWIDQDEEVNEVLSHLLHYRESPLAVGPEPDQRLRNRMSALLGQVRPDLIRQPQPGPIAAAGQRLRRVFGELIMDSANAGLAVTGLRSASPRTRQITFVSDVADLDLELAPSDDGTIWSISGQLGLDEITSDLILWFIPASRVPAPADFEPGEIEGAVSTRLGADGSFLISLPAGDWTAMSEIGDAVVLFREVRI